MLVNVIALDHIMYNLLKKIGFFFFYFLRIPPPTCYTCGVLGNDWSTKIACISLIMLYYQQFLDSVFYQLVSFQLAYRFWVSFWKLTERSNTDVVII